MKEFIMRGQTASGQTHTINFSGHKGDYGFRLVEFQLYGSTAIGSNNFDLHGTLTAGKTAVSPPDPNFNDEGLIGVSTYADNSNSAYGPAATSVINDTFIITQDLILMVQDDGGGSFPVNWQVKFLPVKLSSTEAALTNYRQFSIFDE